MQNLKKLIDPLPSAVILIDGEQKIATANKTARGIFGDEETHLAGKRIGDVAGCVHATAFSQGCGYATACRHCRIMEWMAGAFREKRDGQSFLAKFQTFHRGSRCLQLTLAWMNEARMGDFCGLVPVAMVMVEDLDQVQKRERLEAAMALVGDICHEMNHPLAVLSGQLDLLAMDVGESPRIDTLREQIRRMDDSARKLCFVRDNAIDPYAQSRWNLGEGNCVRKSDVGENSSASGHSR